MCECGNQDYCEALSGEEEDDDDVESDDSSVSGTRDPAENISDNGGVRMAYRAFQVIEGRRRQGRKQRQQQQHLTTRTRTRQSHGRRQCRRRS